MLRAALGQATAMGKVTRVHRELAYKKLNKNTLPGPDDHAGQAWRDQGTDGGPPSFHQETVLAYGMAWGEARVLERSVREAREWNELTALLNTAREKIQAQETEFETRLDGVQRNLELLERTLAHRRLQ